MPSGWEIAFAARLTGGAVRSPAQAEGMVQIVVLATPGFVRVAVVRVVRVLGW